MERRPVDERTPSGHEETRAEQVRRGGRRARLYGATILAIVLVGLIVAWVAANTQTVRVDWLFGSTDAALALVIFVAAVLGWALGIVTAVVIGRRARAPASEKRRPPEELI